MRYVERDPVTREVVGHYNRPQPGRAEEALPADHADLVAYRERQAGAAPAMAPAPPRRARTRR